VKRFADTFYFLALLNVKDEAHLRARTLSIAGCRLVTTEWVLTELADAMASRWKRLQFVHLLALISNDPDMEILPASSPWFAKGAALYAERPDKDWSLTDCISFAVMEERGLSEALTGDHHFEQAGFIALLK